MINNKNAKARESPRQDIEVELPRCPPSTRVPPVIRTKKAATTQAITANVSSQPAIDCQAGRVNRKKLIGLPKIGSTMLLVDGGSYRSEERRVGKECRSRWSP